MATLKEENWSDEHAFNVWKHFGGIGGSDKDTMIKIVTWLLGFSTFVIGVYATGEFKRSFPIWMLPLIGILISLVAAFVSLLYGAYAAWNWAIADRIADTQGWSMQSPTYDPFKAKDERMKKEGRAVGRQEQAVKKSPKTHRVVR